MLRNVVLSLKLGGISPDSVYASGLRSISTNHVNYMPYDARKGPRNWPNYNKLVFPPQEVGEKRRPAYVCHMKMNLRYAAEKMWWVSCMIRGMSIDEAIRQLDYVRKKGAGFVKEALLEAQELAVERHNVEFRSNLWVAESFAGKGFVMKGIRRHARRRIGIVEYKHCHYFVRLEEGSPPEHYYDPMPDGPTLLQRWIDDRRSQRVWSTL